jgi:FAD/FMN-containing dehydrogenase
MTDTQGPGERLLPSGPPSSVSTARDGQRGGAVGRYQADAGLPVLFALDNDGLDRWAAAKARASDAILTNGGTISHHHGVGTDHVAGLAEELGPLMVDTLRAVKHGLDPAGILNPGILLASGGGGP